MNLDLYLEMRMIAVRTFFDVARTPMLITTSVLFLGLCKFVGRRHQTVLIPFLATRPDTCSFYDTHIPGRDESLKHK